MTTTRTPLGVLAAIVALAPAAETARVQAFIDRFRRDIGYTPPELVWQDWGKLSDIVEMLVGAPPLMDEWRVKVVALIMDQPESVILVQFGPRPRATGSAA